jgi:hypothetical protein
MRRGDKADLIGTILDERYPDPPIPLDHRDPYTLLVAVALSAQTTDKKVNQVTPALFERADTPEKMLALGPDEILGLIREVGLAPTKAKNLWLAERIVESGGEVPDWGVPRVAAGRRPQDGQRGDVAGVRPPGLRRRHPHPPPCRPLGPLERHDRRAHRTRSQGRLPGRDVESPAPADHLLRPRVLPGPAPRPALVPDLFVGRDQEANPPRPAADPHADRPPTRTVR